MKKILLILSSVSVLCCSKEAAGPAVSETHSLSVECAGKVQLMDGVSVWNSGDKVSVFYKDNVNMGWLYSGKDKSASGKLVCESELSGTGSWIYALYPYSEGNSLYGSVIHTEIPSLQTNIPGSFGGEAALMAAKTDGMSLSFKYAVAIVRLSLSGSAAISSVVLEGGNGETLCGEAVVDMSGSSPVLSVTGSGKAVTVKENLTSDGVADYFFCVPPGEYSNGFVFNVTYSDGSAQAVRDTRSVTLGPGHMITTQSAMNGIVVLPVHFRNASGVKTNPFTSSPSNSMVGSKTSAFYLKTDGSKRYPFHFFVASKDDGTARLNINSKGALQIGGTAHDYILVPAVEGRTLREVTVCTMSSSKKVCITADDETHTVVAGGETQTSPSGDSPFQMLFAISGSKPSTPYRIEVSGVTMIEYFDLYYSN